MQIRGDGLLKVKQKEIDLLVDWAVNSYGSILHFLKNNWLQLDDYELFLKQMKDIHYTNQHTHCSDYIDVSFNHYRDHRVHFKINPILKDEKIITYERFSKAVWEHLKNIGANRYRHDRCEQLRLF